MSHCVQYNLWTQRFRFITIYEWVSVLQTRVDEISCLIQIIIKPRIEQLISQVLGIDVTNDSLLLFTIRFTKNDQRNYSLFCPNRIQLPKIA